MTDNIIFEQDYRERTVTPKLRAALSRKRLVLLSGPPQSGKTLLARRCFSKFAYIDLGDEAVRNRAATMSAADWRTQHPQAIVDGLHWRPEVLSVLSHATELWYDVRYLVVTRPPIGTADNSTQNLTTVPLLPLTLPELRYAAFGRSIWQALLQTGEMPPLAGSFADDPDYAAKRSAFNHLTNYGGLPALLSPLLRPSQRRQWLSDFVQRYTTTDCRLMLPNHSVTAFARQMRCMAQQSGEPVNKMHISRQCALTTMAVERFNTLLCQTQMGFLLPSWTGMGSDRFTKAPRFHFLDIGLLQALRNDFSPRSGNNLTSVVVAEMYKQARQCGVSVKMWHLRTTTGRVVDLLVELPQGYVGVKVANDPAAIHTTARHIYGLDNLLDKPILHNFLLTADERVGNLLYHTTAIHPAHLLG